MQSRDRDFQNQRFREWKGAGRADKTPWVRPEADTFLERALAGHIRLGVSRGGAVLIPFVGNSRAARLLYDRGFHVCGVEYVPEALARLRAQYFPRHRFRKAVAGRDSARRVIYRSRRIELCQQDCFTFDREEEFDLIYDRAAFIAIEPRRRAQYARIILSALRPGGVLYVITLEYRLRGASKREPASHPR